MKKALESITEYGPIKDYFYYPLTRPLDHTMLSCLDKWAMDKMPLDLIKNSILEKVPIEVHGVYPTLFELYFKSIGISSFIKINFNHFIRLKKYNFIRPYFFETWDKQGCKRIIVCVPPGKDYLFQYAGLIRHCLSLYTKDYETLIEIYRYPNHEKKIPLWTDLTCQFIKKMT